MAKLAKLSAAVGLALTASFAAQASLLFNPDGAAGPLGNFTIDKFDWGPTSILADGGNLAVQNFLANAGDGGSRDTTFWVYTMAKLSVGQLGNTNQFSLDGSGLPNDEITLLVGFREQVTAADVGLGSARFVQIDTTSSFVKMYYDDGTGTASNQLTGAGFGDGTLILDSKADVLGNSTGSFSSDQTDIVDLDQSANGDGWAGQQTVTGTGISNNISFGVDLAGGLTSIDPAFFRNLPLKSLLTTNVSFNTPFVATDPSMGFYTAAAGGTPTPDITLAGGGIDIGTVNDGFGASGGPDFLFSSDFNTSVTATVPEPTSLALLGVGLGIAGIRRARSSKTAK